MTTEEFNQSLARACQDCQAACCKKGQLFLPREEFDRIRAHAAVIGPQAEAEFLARTQDHGSFLLYDQQDRCQFLDERNLCELHPIGIKPSECFWWPYHVYTAGPAQPLEIRLSTSCCEGYRAHGPHSPYPGFIEKSVNEIGPGVIRDFRAKYAGSYDTMPIQPVAELATSYLGADELPAYREAGEKIFPGANWDLGMQRYAEMLRHFPRGLLVVRLRGQILGYLSLWPVRQEFVDRFANDDASDDELTAEMLHRGEPATAVAWFLTSVAIMEPRPALRARIRTRIVEELRGVFAANPATRILAEAVTDRGRQFLERQGFKFVFPGLPQRCVVGSKEFPL